MAIIHESATVRLTNGTADLRAAEGCFVTVDANGVPTLTPASATGTHVATAVKSGVANELPEAYLVPPTTLS